MPDADLFPTAPLHRRAATLGESGFARRPLDAYFTEPWCTEALLGSRVKLPLRILEPACGDGAIVRVLRAAGHQVVASDVADYGLEGAFLRDFLTVGRESTAPAPADVGAIVTNPPYDGGERFIAHAIWLMEPQRGLVAMLLRHEYDCAKQRGYLFRDHPAFACKVTLTRRPRWSEDGENAPRFPFAWFVWDWRHAGPPTLDYAP